MTQRQRFTWTERIVEMRRGLPTPQHCYVERFLMSYSTHLDTFIEHLRAAAEGLERPAFNGYDDWEDEGRPGVCGYRLRTPDERTDAEREDRVTRTRELAELARLQAKYQFSGSLHDGGSVRLG